MNLDNFKAHYINSKNELLEIKVYRAAEYGLNMFEIVFSNEASVIIHLDDDRFVLDNKEKYRYEI